MDMSDIGSKSRHDRPSKVSHLMRQVPFFSLAKVHADVDLNSVFERVRDSSYFILGRELASFERAFESYCNVRHAIGVGNGLDAVALIFRALDLGADDEVIVPAHTFIASWLGVDQAGAKLVPVEVDPATYNLDPEEVRKSIGERTKAILAVHLYGRPAPVEALLEIATPRGIAVIEDAAQAHGALHRGRRTGGLGFAAAFSFYPTKNLGALGDGGAVTTNDDALAERLRMLRNYGSKEKYVHELKGVNSRLDELQAAFLKAKLAHVDAQNQSRREIAARYGRGLRGCPGLTLPGPVEDGDELVWHVYVVRAVRRVVLRASLEARGVATMIHYPIPCFEQGAYRDGQFAGRFSLSRRLAGEVLSLPIWPGMPTEDVEHVIEAVRESCA